MSIQLTQEELQELTKYFAGGQYIDETKTTAGQNELVKTLQLESKRIVHYIYHLEPDSVTVFDVEEAPPPIEIVKINSLIENNDQFRSLLNN
jgi:hypothetical protein